jgi:serine/threonine-protein kinase RsbW
MIETKNIPASSTLKIASTGEQISPIGEALHAICLNITGSESCAQQVQFAVVEALNNIVLHAYNNQAGNDIIVRWSQENRFLRIEIIDYGKSLSYLPPAILPDFERENGRGWWIINACVDDYYYSVSENIDRERIFKLEGSNSYSEDITIKSHINILTLIKSF